MKKFLALFLCLLLSLSFCGCSELGISEEDITSAVVGAIIDGIESGIEESFSQSDEAESENDAQAESKTEENTETEPESEDEDEGESQNEDITPHESEIFFEDGTIGAHESEFIEEFPQGEIDDETSEAILDEYGEYYTKDEVALYIHTYNKLPLNFITKDEARDLGWEGGSVEDVCGEGLAIGGDKFGNREGLLPKKNGRQYYECDIDTVGKSSRGAKRIVFSNDGLIYYTGDHYESFELLYSQP